MVKLNWWTTPSVGKNIKQLESHIITSGNTNDTDTLKKSLAVSHKVKYTLILWPRNLTLGIFPREIKKYFYTKSCI